MCYCLRQEVRHFEECWRNMEAKDKENRRYLVATPCIREGALPRAKDEESSKIILVATTPIRESALTGTKHEETSKVIMVANFHSWGSSDKENTKTKKMPAVWSNCQSVMNKMC